ncbi:MAG: bifunctional 3-deoxy-7-phosphoheptulonate synthase/chorismate mutase type II [Bacteroidia bacterium]|nr:bifunctional 3-deoxy-7-phosphoheptulonate synthase/chorismate mutase type II [Bacteroidia bacterium]
MKEYFNDIRPWLIAGPCSAESEEQVLTTARALKDFGVSVFRAGIWKPRTHPGCFEGIGEKGLPWLREVQEQTGMKVCTEVANASHVKACLDAGVDMLWIGARTTSNPFLVQEIAESLSGTDVPVLVKNPVNADLGLWTGAIERFRAQDVRNLGIIHRGFSTFDKIRYRNAPHWRYAIEMRTRFPELPFFCDPSHMAGSTEFIAEISQRALDLGMDGLMIESHCRPQCALSDASQQLTPSALAGLVGSLTVREQVAGNDDALDGMRARIDAVDDDLVRLLAERMDISREIGNYKKERNIAIIQSARFEELLGAAKKLGATYGLDGDFLVRIFNMIHDASAAEQNKIISEK